MKFLLVVILSVAFAESIWAAEEIYNFNPSVGKYYKFHREPLTWFNARNACQNEGATLALPENEAEMNILKDYFNANYPHESLGELVHRDHILMGFHDQFRENEFLSLQGKSLQYFFHKWGYGQPDNSGNEDCGSLLRSGFYNDIPCSTPSVFMCEKTETNGLHFKTSKPEEYKCQKEMGMCYKLHWNPRPWAEARAICYAEGGQLAIIRNKAVEEFLVKIFNNLEDLVLNVKYYNYTLIGFHDLYSIGHFVTVEDKDISSYGYLNWATGQPDNTDIEQCGSMSREGFLYDFPCSVPAVFLCEKLMGG